MLNNVNDFVNVIMIMKRSFINCVMAAALIVAAIPVWGSKPLAVKAGK